MAPPPVVAGEKNERRLERIPLASHINVVLAHGAVKFANGCKEQRLALMLSSGKGARRRSPRRTGAAGWLSLPRIPGLGEGIENDECQRKAHVPHVRLAPSALSHEQPARGEQRNYPCGPVDLGADVR
jgi:hypothetical protein